MESFNLGRTLSRTFSLTFGTITTVGVFILVLQAAGLVVQYFTQQMMLDDVMTASSSGDPDAALAIFGSAGYWLSVLVSLAIATLTLSGAVHGYLRNAAGEAVGIGDCFSNGVAKFLPVLGLLILWILGVWAGLILLVVPGIILICMWSVSLPALVGESRGIIAAFGRSRELTKGSRLMIFLALLIFIILVYIAIFVLMAALMGSAMAGGLAGSPAMMGMMGIGAMIAMLPVQWLFTAILTALLVSIYIETVTVKEGGFTQQLGDVFE